MKNYTPKLMLLFILFMNIGIAGKDQLPIHNDKTYQLLSLPTEKKGSSLEIGIFSYGIIPISRLDPRALQKIRPKKLSAIKKMLNELVLKHGFDEKEANSIYASLEKARDLSVDPEEFPKILKDYLANKNNFTRSLEELTRDLQYARGVITNPYSHNELERNPNASEAEDQLTFMKDHATLYELNRLWEFIDVKSQMKSLMEMHLYPDIVEIICLVAIHKDASEIHQSECLSLLSRRENLNDYETALIELAAINFNSANSVLKKQDEQQETIYQLQKTVNRLSGQLNETNAKLDLLTSLLLKNQSESNPRKKVKTDNSEKMEVDHNKNVNPYTFSFS